MRQAGLDRAPGLARRHLSALAFPGLDIPARALVVVLVVHGGQGLRPGGLGAVDQRLPLVAAGIGERSARIRAAISRGLAWTGVRLDENRNAANKTRISADDAKVPIYVISADEELPIARAVSGQLLPA